MLGVVEEGLGFRDLDDSAEVHHGHSVSDLPHGAQVMADEQVGQIGRAHV